MKLWLLILLSCFFSIRAAHAYGPIGHEIVGGIADELLASKPAGEKVHALLDGMTLEKPRLLRMKFEAGTRTARMIRTFFITQRARGLMRCCAITGRRISRRTT